MCNEVLKELCATVNNVIKSYIYPILALILVLQSCKIVGMKAFKLFASSECEYNVCV